MWYHNLERHMNKAERKAIQEPWQVLQAIYKVMSIRGDLLVYLSVEEFPHLKLYLQDILSRLQKVERIVEVKPGDDLGVNLAVTDKKRFMALYESYKKKAREVSDIYQTQEAGLNLIVHYFPKGGILMWFSEDYRLLGECEIGSECGQKVMALLWGSRKRLPLLEALNQWSDRKRGINGLTGELMMSDAKVRTAIDVVNRSLKRKNAPLSIQVAGKAASISSVVTPNRKQQKTAEHN